jgi:RNA polymerase sigma-70 factor, ECF subfamily
VQANSEAVSAAPVPTIPLDLESVFHAQYARLARTIAGVIRDPARAEELAVEVLLKWSRTPAAQREGSDGWLYRTAVRAGLDELRRQARRGRYERLFGFARKSSAPDELLAARQEQEKVRLILTTLRPRQAELLVLRSQGLSYDQLAVTLKLNPASVGTLLSRAQKEFRKEYVKRYGTA